MFVRLARAGTFLLVTVYCASPASPESRDPATPLAAPEVPLSDPPVPSEPPLRVQPIPELSPLSPPILERLREIREASDRRQEDVFMKVGDSSTVSRGFLTCFSDPEEVILDEHEDLQESLDFFRGGRAGARDPFRRRSRAAAEGWSTRQVLDGNPPPLLTEVRAIRPRYAFVMNGGNDVQGHDDYQYATRLLRIVEMLSGQGVIPILNSLPPRTDEAEADAWVERYNQISWAVAMSRHLPYIDYNQVMRVLPRMGLAGDGVHPNIFIEDQRAHACRFDAAGLDFGHNARNLLALRALDALRAANTAPDEETEGEHEEVEYSLAGQGTAASPYEVRTLPFAAVYDTAVDGSSTIDSYPGCHAEQTETGREVVFRLVVGEPMRVRLLAVGRRDTDVDVHLLGARADGDACVERADREIVRELTPGVWHLCVDTFALNGEPQAGETMVLISPIASH